MISSQSMNSLDPPPFAQNPAGLEYLTALSYRSGDLGAYLTEIVLGVSRLIESDWSIVTISEGETGQVVASSLEMQWDDAGFSMHGTLVNEVVRSGQVLIIEDSHRTLGQAKPPQDYLCYLGVPLRTASSEVIGTICSFLRQPRLFTDSEVKIVERFAERAATAIENFRLYQQQLQLNQRLSQEVTDRTFDLQLAQEKLIERERLAAIGEFTAMIVHEVRNPLTTIEMGLRHAQKVLQADADQQRLALAVSESQRLKHLLHDILCYAKPQSLHLTRLNIGEFLHDLLMQVRDLPEACERQIEYDPGTQEFEIMADLDKLKQVFLNLFRNACEAIAPHETVSCLLREPINPGQIWITVHNGGKPIPPELLPMIATPFCSTKPSGTGLGLAISKRIIVAHGGELEIASSSSGTTVSLYLPICSSVV